MHNLYQWDAREKEIWTQAYVLNGHHLNYDLLSLCSQADSLKGDLTLSGKFQAGLIALRWIKSLDGKAYACWNDGSLGARE